MAVAAVMDGLGMLVAAVEAMGAVTPEPAAAEALAGAAAEGGLGKPNPLSSSWPRAMAAEAAMTVAEAAATVAEAMTSVNALLPETAALGIALEGRAVPAGCLAVGLDACSPAAALAVAALPTLGIRDEEADSPETRAGTPWRLCSDEEEEVTLLPTLFLCCCWPLANHASERPGANVGLATCMLADDAAAAGRPTGAAAHPLPALRGGRLAFS